MNDTTKLHTKGCRGGFCSGGVLGILLLLMALPAQAQVEGISYTISPGGENVFFESKGFLGSDGNSGLENGLLYGGQLGLGFGQYLELDAVYLFGNDFETDFTNLDDDAFDFGVGEAAFLDALADLEPRMIDLRRYGGKLRLNLGAGFGTAQAGEFLPYLTLGTGIIKFDPEGLDKSESIYATGGVGVTFSLLNRLTVSVGGEVLAYRYNPATVLLTDSDITAANDAAGLAGADRIQADDFEDQTVLNPSLNASVQFYLGGRQPGELSELDRAFIEQFQGGGGLQVFVEPFYGRIEFNSALNFPKDQNVAGVNVGVELGPYVGLRGFYWRGTTGTDVFDEFAEGFEDVALFGGELNLRFGDAFGRQDLTPYAIVGGGFMDVLGNYDEDISQGATPPDDRYFAMGGGGLDFALSESLSLFGNLRYLLMSNADAEDVSDPDEVFGSPMYTAGLKFSFGGGRGRTAEEVIEERAERRAAAARAEREALRGELTEREEALQTEVARLRARLDSLEQARQERRMVQEEDSVQQTTVREMTALEQKVDQLEREVAGGAQGRVRRPGSNLSGETIAIPVPERGEIYIRFGEGANGETTAETVYAPPTIVQPGGQATVPQTGAQGGLSAQQIQQIVRETLRSEMGRADSARRPLNAEDIRRIVQETITEQLRQADTGEVQRMEMSQLQNRLDRIESRLDRLAEQRAAPPPGVEVIEEGQEGEERTRVVSQYGPTRVVPTAGFGGGNFLFGVRGDYSDRSSHIGSLDFRFMPEFVVGGGDEFSVDIIANGVVDVNLLDQYLPTDRFDPYAGVGLGLTTQTGLGLNLLIGTEYATGRGAVFAEYSTLDFFDYNRFLIGYRVRF